MREPESLCGLTADEVLSLIEPSGFRYSHATLVTNCIYKKRIRDINHLPGISNKLRNLLSGSHVPGISSPEQSLESVDGSKKYLFRSRSGLLYETVYIPDGKRHTVCVSVQSGCRMGCKLCATARYGFHGNLTAGEMVNQVIGIPEAHLVTHVVFMGMGEPLDNTGEVFRACSIMTAEWGLSLSPANITVSTVGITAEVENFLRSSECNLTLSLFSPFPDERILYIPAERNHPSGKILEIIRSFPARKRRRMSVAYVMIKGLNDTDSHLDGLKSLLAGSSVRVNLLPYHATGDSGFVSSSEERMMYFKHSLVISGISASVRKTRGADIHAACGLLASGLADYKRKAY
ncbi:MAG: radical SAM protein [Bacteroidales bacterium]|nr:radical SAM protein [Bacteroidales bacterium]